MMTSETIRGIDDLGDLAESLAMLDAGRLATEAWGFLAKAPAILDDIKGTDGCSVRGLLGQFIGAKLDGIRERLRGNVNNATEHENRAERVYNRLPAEWIW